MGYRLGNALHAMENGRLGQLFKRKLSDADVAAIRLRVTAGEAQTSHRTEILGAYSARFSYSRR